MAEKERRNLKNFRIDEEVGTRSSPDIPKPDGRIDIRIIYSFDESEYFGMECKRVSGKDKRLARDYLSKGILRFVTGKYSPGHTWAAMLGFVIDGDMAGSLKLICDCLSTNKSVCDMKGDWSREVGFGPHQNLYCTQHYQRGRNSEMNIFHLLLSIDGPASIKSRPPGKQKSGSLNRRTI